MPLGRVLQRGLATLLASRWGAALVLLLAVLTLHALLRTTDQLLGSSLVCPRGATAEAAASFATASDNIVGRPLDATSMFEPIDAVYTWVNGSDPGHRKLVRTWQAIERALEAARNGTNATHNGSTTAGDIISRAQAAASASPAKKVTSDDDDDDADAGTEAAQELAPVAGSISEEQASASRFEEHDELRYSMRSLERFAPWVRHVYIVTNGQVPTWLNLDHPRVTVVPHSAIFANVSHLPTFSSPSIETHLHRIPGLSRRFLYLNDDTFFAAPIVPDDYYSPTKGHRVYLSWGVPNCAPSCPPSWLKDGFCDQPCNVSECAWDAGDCVGDAVKMSPEWMTGGHQPPGFRPPLGPAGKAAGGATPAPGGPPLCSPMCADDWLGDRTCDSPCEVAECGYDATDCGFGRLGVAVRGGAAFRAGPDAALIVGHNLTRSRRRVEIPATATAVVIDLSSIFPRGSAQLTQGAHCSPSWIRAAVLSQPRKALVLVLHADKRLAQLPRVCEIRVTGTVPTGRPSAAAQRTIEHAFNLTIAPRHDDRGDGGNSSARHAHNVASGPSSRHLLAVSVDEDARRQHRTRATLPIRVRHDDDDGHSEEKQRPATAASRHGDGAAVGGSNAALRSEERAQVKRRALDKALAAERDAAARAGGWRSVARAVFAPGLDGTETNDAAAAAVAAGGAWAASGAASEGARSRRNGHTRSGASPSQRQLLDMFGDSLKHANNLMSMKYGPSARKVPAHMVHLIDRDVVNAVQALWPKEFDATSASRFRSPKDMQYAFTHFYYIMHAERAFNATAVFEDEIDLNGNGVVDSSPLLEDRRIGLLLWEKKVTVETLEKALVSACIAAGELRCNETGNASATEETGNTTTSNMSHYVAEPPATTSNASAHRRANSSHAARRVNLTAALRRQRLLASQRRYRRNATHHGRRQQLQEGDGDGDAIEDDPLLPSETPVGSELTAEEQRAAELQKQHHQLLQNRHQRHVFAPGPTPNEQHRLRAVRPTGEEVHPMTTEYFARALRLVAYAARGIRVDGVHASPPVSGPLTAATFEGSHLAEVLVEVFGSVPSYKFQLEDLDDVTFFMVRDNATVVGSQMDHVLHKRPKFLCVNDNMNHSHPEHKRVVATLQQLFAAYYPRASMFELPDGQRNPFLSLDEKAAMEEKAESGRAVTTMTRRFEQWWVASFEDSDAGAAALRVHSVAVFRAYGVYIVLLVGVLAALLVWGAVSGWRRAGARRAPSPPPKRGGRR